MIPYLPDLAERPVPRYTSYPTAAQFGSGVGAVEQRAALIRIAPGTAVSLYLHIPYCRQICWYCGCNTGAVRDEMTREGRLSAYVQALHAEIETVAPLMRGRVTGIQFGGGSPNSMPAAALCGIITDLWQQFDVAADAEIGVELDPRGLDGGYIASLAAVGVNRLSLGVQTLAPHVQAAINRIQPLGMIADAVRAARANGIAGINFDLMYGLPLQTNADLADTIAKALTLAPDRVAVFGYAHMPAMIARQRMIADAELPDAETRFTQSALAHAAFTEGGYVAIGFDHFARPDDPMAIAAAAGTLHRNFQGYATHPGEATIGLGATAISQFDDLIVQNDKHVAGWRNTVLAGGLAGVRGVARTADDRARGRIIERLLCDGFVDVGDDYPPAIEALRSYADAGLIRLEAGAVRLMPGGWPYARLIAAAFDAHFDGARHSKAI
ncbi:oxygen-independent coproporphyrinogen III oxidase [Polymorphobacter sp.]|uniref:oxygen-independent coproporphyrinogen III oxidase n=1 Tax=Polymorphobacter sp. TaxID=1909290 RepID=UPI003F7311C5